MHRIRSYIGNLFACALVFVWPIFLVQAEEINESIPSPVEITSFEMNTHSAEVGDVVKYEMLLNDVGIKAFLEKYGARYNVDNGYSSVSNIQLCWMSSKKQTVIHTYEWSTDATLANTKQLMIRGLIPIRKGMQQGEWTLKRIRFVVSVDDGEEFYIDDMRSGEAPILLDLSMADFNVSGTGKADHKPPTIDLKSLKVSKRYLKKNQKATFSVKVKDQSEIKKVECDWNLYEYEDNGKRFCRTKNVEMKYNKKTKKYQHSIGLTCKKAQLSAITVTDIYGNKKTYHGDRSLQYAPNKKDRKYYNAYKKMIIIAK